MSTYRFISFKDCGATSCPHCGAEGRYIYTWEQDGRVYSAMAGCFKLLTGKLEKDDVTKFLEQLTVKLEKSKDLTGWDKQAAGILRAVSEKRASNDWATRKLAEIVSSRKSYLTRKRY